MTLTAVTRRAWLIHAGRLFPTSTLLVFGAVGAAWAIASRLDAPIEVTTLAIIGSGALSMVFGDDAAAVTAASMVPLGWRRIVPGMLGVLAATSIWWAARSLATVAHSAPMPGRWDLLEWITVALSQIAVGAVVARRRPESSTFGPGLLVGVTWYAIALAPRLQTLLRPVDDHLARWIALIAIFTAMMCASSIDPARRTRTGVPR